MGEASRLPIGVALGTIGLDGDAWLRVAARLATGPIDRLWVWDHLMGRGAPERPVLEATIVAAALLSAHPTLRVGTLVLDVTKRHPALVAKIAATLDAVAPGRFALGIGAGGDAAEHDALGLPFGETAERIKSLVRQAGVARAMLNGDPRERIQLPGARSADGAASAPRPGGRVPLLVAGDHPSSIRLAAEVADEWVAPVATFAAGIEQLRQREQAIGRTNPTVRAHLLHELSANERFADSPFGRAPEATWAAARAAGADALIVTVRTERDAEEMLGAMANLR